MSQKAPFYHWESVRYNFKVFLLCNKNLFEGSFFFDTANSTGIGLGLVLKKKLSGVNVILKNYSIFLISETWNNHTDCFGFFFSSFNLTWHELKNSQRPVVLLCALRFIASYYYLFSALIIGPRLIDCLISSQPDIDWSVWAQLLTQKICCLDRRGTVEGFT